MSGKGAEAKMPLTEGELKVALAVLQRGTYKHSGMRSAAAAISALRGAHEAVTPKAKRKRTVSARWLGRQLTECGVDVSAALIRIQQRRSKARRTERPTVYGGTRITRQKDASESPDSAGQPAGAQQTEPARPANDVVVAGGSKA